MNFEMQWIDASTNIKDRTQPIVFFDRPRASVSSAATTASVVARVGDFYVPVSPLLLPEVQWSCTTTGDYVRVPLFGYDTRSESRGSVAATGIELGARACASLAGRLGRKLPSDVTLFMHRSVDATGEIGGRKYRMYLGLMFRCDK